jgi:hypothetical protein
MNYKAKVIEHLTNYKKVNFPGLPDGLYKKNNLPYSHILPDENKFENLLPKYRNDLAKYLIDNKVKPHKDFHHLNSSQAMCFNFFFPLYQERSLELVTDFLGLKDEKVNYESVCFEKDGLEAQYGRVPTSFDFYFETTSSKKIHFEIKYTEAEFKKAEINQSKFESVYSKHLKHINTDFHNPQQFFNNYQILRNLIHIGDNSYVVFIYPADNDKISNEATKVKTDFLTGNFHNHFHAETWETILKSISLSTTNSNLTTQFADFKNKYLV